MIFTLWDTIEDDIWRRTPTEVVVYPAGSDPVLIDSQWQAEQGNWDNLTAWKIYEQWFSPDPAPLGYLEPVVEEIDGRARAARYPAGTDEERAAATRQQKLEEIDAQVPDGGARQLAEDPLFEGSIRSYSGGSSERKSELEDTPDEEVADFNTTVIPTPLDGSGYVQAQMTTFIDIVDPWVGAPQDVYALRVVMRVLTEGQAQDGESARAHMFNGEGVDQGVLPFEQDATDPTIWRCQSQEGRYWSDPEATAFMRLYWDSGSLPVAETKELDGFGDRQYAIVRAGLPAARVRR